MTRSAGVATVMVTHDLPTLASVDAIYDMMDAVLTEQKREVAAA